MPDLADAEVPADEVPADVVEDGDSASDDYAHDEALGSTPVRPAAVPT